MRVDPGNIGQAAAWDGDEGDFWAANPQGLDREQQGRSRLRALLLDRTGLEGAALGSARRLVTVEV